MQELATALVCTVSSKQILPVLVQLGLNLGLCNGWGTVSIGVQVVPIGIIIKDCDHMLDTPIQVVLGL